MAKLEDHKPLLFKVDFEKAFDSVSWSYLQDIMRQMRFDIKCRKWIDACFSTTSITVLINGSPSKELKMEKVIRQGDPLSPLLFFLVVEALQVSITEACRSSGLKVNISKSRLIGVGVPTVDVEQVVGSLGCAFDQMLFLYLGLPVRRSMKACGGWNEVVDRLDSRLEMLRTYLLGEAYSRVIGFW
ncbi:putative RNA-directed DNA polymerase, eukaryota, reverse transcriptase zinc-binding domain protein [Tanacetum coccineum]